MTENKDSITGMVASSYRLRHGGAAAPLALVATARLRGLALETIAAPELAKDAPPELLLPTG